MRVAGAVVLAGLCLALPACNGSGNDGPESPGSVTFTGTAGADSMAPTIITGDRIVAVAVGPTGPVAGDIVVYQNPGGWLASREDDEGKLVHRVIATSGDTLHCCELDGRVSVNGAPVDEQYIATRLSECNARILGGMTEAGTPLAAPCGWTAGPVPDGMLFVMGDNRDNSADSRFHLCPGGESSCANGPWVPTSLVVGVVETP